MCRYLHFKGMGCNKRIELLTSESQSGALPLRQKHHELIHLLYHIVIVIASGIWYNDIRKERHMLLFFHNVLTQRHLTVQEFFTTSYIWRFHPPRFVDLTGDYYRYIKTGELPPYAVEFLKDIERQSCAVQNVQEQSNPTNMS